MAAFHLLPREIVLLVGRHQSYPFLGRHPHLRHLDALLCASGSSSLQWPRFRSDYRRTEVDEKLAREFDEPMRGYERSSIKESKGSSSPHFFDATASLPQAGRSWMEEETYEYIGDSARDRSLTIMAEQPEASTSQVVEQHEMELRRFREVYEHVQACQGRGDIESAVAWLEEVPRHILVELHQWRGREHSYGRLLKTERSFYLGILRRLQSTLLNKHGQNIPLLCKFGLLTARQGFATLLKHDLPAHIARFSTFEQVQPFWTGLTAAARSIALSSAYPDRAKAHLERSLKTSINLMIRAQCLAGRYLDSLKLLKIARDISGRVCDVTENDRTVGGIDAFTYTLVIQELQRHETHPDLVRDAIALAKEDWPQPYLRKAIVPEQSMGAEDEVSTEASVESHERAQRGRHQSRDTYASLLALFPDRTVPSQRDLELFMRQNTLRRSRKDGPRLLRRTRQSGPTSLTPTLQPKLEYVRLWHACHSKQTRPSVKELQAFLSSCKKTDNMHLARALAHKLSEPRVVRLYEDLMARMREGELPSTRKLKEFMVLCQENRRLSLAKQMGDWMESQHIRFRTLWYTARMYRLLHLGKRSDLKRCIQLFGEKFQMVGVPDQLKDLVEELRQPSAQSYDLVGPSRNVRYWPSSHNIAIALNALLALNPSRAYISAAHSSFMQNTYDASSYLPLPAHPDQVTYSSFLKAYIRIDKISDAMQVLVGMRERGIMPNSHNWTTLLGGMSKQAGGSWAELCRAVLDRMEESALPPQDSAYPSIEAPASTLDRSLIGFQGDMAPLPSLPSLAQIPRSRESRSTADFLSQFTFSPPSIATYCTLIRGSCLSTSPQALSAAKYYRKKLYDAKNEAGERLYSFSSKNPYADRALDILASVDRMHIRGAEADAERQTLRSSRH